MNRLWLQLTLAFAIVTLIGVLVAGLLANFQVSAQFRRFVNQNQVADSPLGAALIDHYVQNGGWVGVETVFAELSGPGGMGHGMGMRRGMPDLILADASGQIVYNWAGPGRLTRLSQAEQAEAISLEWQGQTIGYLAFAGSGMPGLNPLAQSFLGQFNRSLWLAGVIAGGLGILIGLVIARGLSAPLGRLAMAARRISQGDLSQRVSVKGSAEVTDLGQAFNEMAVGLQQAESLRRNLVADVAHELRTPLSVIQGNLQAILDDVYPLEKSEIAVIYDETLILSRLVNDLRELAQAEAGQLSLKLQPLNLADLLERAVNLFAEPAQAKNIELQLNLPSNLPTVQADPDRIRQVLQNLLANALRHTPEGGRVTVSAQEVPGSRGAEKQGGNDSPLRTPAPTYVEISVLDTGSGLMAEELPHVFDRFWRADRARAREQGGSGLGLAIAKQLVEAHDGQIGVASTPGQGSCFWFRLPVDR